MKVEAPIVLDRDPGAEGSALNWRVLIVLEEGAEAEVWEQYAQHRAGLFTTVVDPCRSPHCAPVLRGGGSRYSRDQRRG